MKNSIVASIVCSFKGETHAPAATIDLDATMAAHGHLPDLHATIATQNHIDTYSYLYEVMESQEIEFSQATGIAADCLIDGVFDRHAFEQRWLAQQELAVLGPIARHHLQIDDLTQHPELKAALQAAFEAGKDAGN